MDWNTHITPSHSKKIPINWPLIVICRQGHNPWKKAANPRRQPDDWL